MQLVVAKESFEGNSLGLSHFLLSCGYMRLCGWIKNFPDRVNRAVWCHVLSMPVRKCNMLTVAHFMLLTLPVVHREPVLTVNGNRRLSVGHIWPIDFRSEDTHLRSVSSFTPEIRTEFVMSTQMQCYLNSGIGISFMQQAHWRVYTTIRCSHPS